MKILHKKILIFVVILTVVLSTFVVSSFAFESGYGDEYVFNEVLSFDVGYPSSAEVYFDCNGVLYWKIEITSVPGTAGATPMITYYDHADNIAIDVYIDGRWVDDSYRYLYFVGGSELSPEFVSFMDNNEYIAPTGWYWDLYDVISSSIFHDGDEVPQEAAFSIALVSIILCLLSILLPVLLTFGIFIWVIKRV